MQAQTETPDHHNPSEFTVSSSSSSSLSPTTSSCSSLGDYIGMESCFDLKKSGEEDFPFWACGGEEEEEGKRREYQYHYQFRCPAVKREFPPPIPLLARTENLSAHMPWVLRRYYTDDGRLILREERVKHHEYFKAHRSNGRLTLQLVPLDDEVLSPPIVSSNEDGDEDEEIEDGVVTEEPEEELSGSFLEKEVDKEGNVGNVRSNGGNVEHLTVEKLAVDNGGVGLGSNGGGGGKCLDYSKLTAGNSSCFLGMSFPAMRPVHS